MLSNVEYWFYGPSEFTALGGVALAAELGTGSVAYPNVTASEERARVAASGSVAVVLPATRFQHLLPGEALNASTINAAYAIGMGECAGSLCIPLGR